MKKCRKYPNFYLKKREVAVEIVKMKRVKKKIIPLFFFNIIKEEENEEEDLKFPKLDRSSQAVINKQALKDIDKGFQYLKNNENIKENKILIKICEIFIKLVQAYVKNGINHDISAAKSI